MPPKKKTATVAPPTITPLSEKDLPKSHPLCGKSIKYEILPDPNVGRKSRKGKTKLQYGDATAVLIDGKWYWTNSLTMEKA